VADDMDLAQGINEQHLVDSLAEHQRKTAADRSRTSQRECEDCGEEIPEARRLAAPGCRRCLECQATFEIHTHWRPI
jgi:phage/conjugal plasmid C-4 type zinc finger TraR family protein